MKTKQFTNGFTKLAIMLVAVFSLISASATELIVNGGFELGSSPWTFSGGVSASSAYSFARSGSYYAWFGGAVNESDAGYQTITIPANATAATLSFYYNINSLELNTVAYDTFSATIRNTSGTVLATVGNWSNMNQDGGPGNPYYHQKTFNLLPYAGQTIRIYFSSVNDPSKVTNFRVDDVSVQVTTNTALSITTTAFNPATATVGTGYAALEAVTATGGQTPYSWSASGLPSGMAINSSSGALYGTPTVAGTFNVTVTVTDSSSPQKTASKVLTLAVSCSYSLSPTSISPSSGSGSGSFGVTAGSGCTWTATANQTWIHSSNSGSGNGTVSYTFDANSGSARSGTITVGGQPFTITQSGSTGLSAFLAFPLAGYTAYSNKLVTAVFDHYSGGVLTHQVTSTAADDIVEAFNGEHAEKIFGDNGSGAYKKDFQGTPVTLDGIYKYAGTAAQYLQYDGHRGIDFGVAQGTAVFAAAGGTVDAAGWENPANTNQGFGLRVRLSHNNGYYTYYGHLSSLSVSAGATVAEGDPIGLSGMTGSATGPHLHFEVRHQTTGASRDPYGYQGSDVLWKTAVPCNYSLNPTSANPGPGSGSGSFSVTAGGGCTWSASTAYNWIHTTSSGNGSGTVNYTFDANGGSARSGTISVGNRTFTVNQVGFAPPIAGSPKRTGTTFTLSVPTQVGFNYTLEYKNSFSDANWTVGQTLSGTGGTITLTDTGATGPRRLYHVRIN